MSKKITTYSAMQGSMQSRPNQSYRHEMLDDDGRPSKKPRASKPKVKSGCITCKTRRVKCDETKPECLRCQKFGRNCDGYAPEPPRAKGLMQLQPRIPTVDIHGPSVSIHTTEAESRYFRYFIEHAAVELSGYFEPIFWTQTCLQESHNVPAIRHAVIAMGALSKSLEAAPEPALKVNIIQNINKAHHEQAVFQHIKAIQALNQYISSSKSPQLRNALIACMLFVCFETFQGSYASSVQQVYGGLKILRNYYVGTPGSRPWIPEKRSPGLLDSTGRKETSQALPEREGHEATSKEPAITMHVEENLDSETGPRWEEEVERLHHQDRQSSLIKCPLYDPTLEHIKMPPMTDTNFSQEQQETLTSYAPSMAIRKPSTEFQSCPDTRLLEVPSQTESSTSVHNTPPTTGPHTPSPVQATHPQTFQPSSSLNSNRKRLIVSQSPTPSLQNDLTIEETLIQSFVRLDGQGLFFGLTPGIPPLIWDIHKVFHLPVPPSFASFPEAQRCWDFLMDRALNFYRRTAFNRAYDPLSADTPVVITQLHTVHVEALSAFEKAFQPLLDAAVSSEGEVLNPAALVLSLYPKCVEMMLATLMDESEMLYDDFFPSFEHIVRTCGLLIAAEDKIHLPKNRRFSLEVGIIPPLHMTATKCRDSALRKEAIDLLFKSPRQECLWDGVLSARVGMWIMGCEENELTKRNNGNERSKSSSKTQAQASSDYPSPPHLSDDEDHGGAYQDGKKICNVVNMMVNDGIEFKSKARQLYQSPLARRSFSGNGREVESPVVRGRVVPEANRVQLKVVEFHIPDRYIKVKCQRALRGKDGTREERETVIAW